MSLPESPFSLRGRRVALRPLRAADGEALLEAAADGCLWESRLTRVPGPDTLGAYLDQAEAARLRGDAIPFVTTLADSGEVVGATRFWQIDKAHRKLEIGHTWIARRWQRSFVNTEAKYLMLRFAFEHAGCVRVQFQTDALNLASRRAILRLGAVEEGIARNERIMADGRKRDSVQYSIIDGEWPAVRRGLEEKLFAGGIEPSWRLEEEQSSAPGVPA